MENEIIKVEVWIRSNQISGEEGSKIMMSGERKIIGWWTTQFLCWTGEKKRGEEETLAKEKITKHCIFGEFEVRGRILSL